jgi:hypothetical protein
MVHLLGDLGQGDVRVGDALDLATSVLHGLDTETCKFVSYCIFLASQ